jgi:cyclopropane fatty-acyl-phospholipid synthase-like methyltransferase
MEPGFTMNSFAGKQVLALVRGGDYAHAGEEEAIEMTMRGVWKNPSQRILDAGCGRGGTAAYMQRNGWGMVSAFDRDEESIVEARRTYPEVEFEVCDILECDRTFGADFDVITLFNVLYALPDHRRVFDTLSRLQKTGTQLLIFDYFLPEGSTGSGLLEGDLPMLPNPPHLKTLDAMLEKTGWHAVGSEDITADYARWYQGLVERIEARKREVEDLVGPDGFAHVLRHYSDLQAALTDGRVRGAIIKAINA